VGFLPEYEDDIFISYAHNDNQALSGQRRWVETFHEALERRLPVYLGAKPSIWRDPRLQGNEYFADTLVEQIPKVAILISILSPSYINSEWCRREMTMFADIANATGGMRLGNKARIFKIEKISVPLDKHPPELQGMTGYQFFYMDNARARELSADSGPHAIDYWQRIDDVAQDIATLMQDMKNRGSSATADVQVFQTPAPGETIYLAETSFDLSPQRDNIKRELQERGHMVIPDRPLPLNGPALEDAVRHYLDTSKLSIHLIGANYGVIPEAADRSVVCLQNDLAAERCKGNGFARLIWLPEGLETREERQRQFVDYLTHDATAQHGADVLQTSIEELKTYIQDKLRPKPKPAPANGNGNGNGHKADDGPLRVYLICDKQDYEAIAPISDHLFDQGFEVTLPLFEGDEAEVREDHKESLLICDAVVIFYGNSSEGWLRTKLRDLQKIPGYGRTKPMLAQAIYTGPPENPTKQRYRTREALLLRNFSDFTPDAIQPFIEEINRAKR
jgi:hypothetical protein